MTNPNTLLAGRRPLSAEDKALLDEIAEHAERTRHLVHRVEHFLLERQEKPLPEGHAPASVVTHPLRWLSDGRTDLQKGFMSLKRAVAQPETF